MNGWIGRRRLVSGSVLGLLGFILSPLSWWNDLFVNVPLAYLGGWLVSLFYKPAFEVAFIVSYWITNILGFFLLHKGICQIVKKDCSSRAYLKHDLLKDLLIGLSYTALLLILVRLKIIQPIGEYFK